MKKLVFVLLAFLVGGSMAVESKKLVVYFSRTGENYGVGVIEKGNTEIVAEIIAGHVGATLLKVEPVKAYPSGYDECTSVAKKELSAEARPEVKPASVNPEDFDEIYVGYPVWWGEMPMPMFTFLEKYNLKGKRIFPFVTHEGSGLSGVKRLEEATGGDVQKGLAVYGHEAQGNRAKVEKAVLKWLK